jgi:hypothetical protein
MTRYFTVSDVSNELEQRYGVAVPPRILSDLIYQRLLPVNRCPIVGGRRLIPLDLLPAIEAKLRERGNIGRAGREDAV